MFAEASRQSLNTLCASLVTPSLQSPPKNTTAIVQVGQYAQDAGYGYDVTNCPNSCSGHGTCGSSGCSCLDPWTGSDCSLNQNQPIAVVAAVASVESAAVTVAPVNNLALNSSSVSRVLNTSSAGKYVFNLLGAGGFFILVSSCVFFV